MLHDVVESGRCLCGLKDARQGSLAKVDRAQRARAPRRARLVRVRVGVGVRVRVRVRVRTRARVRVRVVTWLR